jgi:RNA polymerase sigma factor for flagellar operon FliA
MNSLMAISNSSGKSSSSKDELLQQLNQGVLSWPELDGASRQVVVEGLAQKVNIIAKRLKVKLPQHVELKELLSAGSLGLLESLDHFDASQGVKLETFVESRIRGAMLDELRRQDWFSRGLRQNIRTVEQVKRQLEQSLGREPDQKELREATGLSHRELSETLEALQHQIWLSLDHLEPHCAPASKKTTENDPYSSTLKQELVDKVGKYIEDLTSREQMVLSLYYTEELTMRETAEIMDITEGRVSQLHQQALQKLQARFRKEGA